MKKKENCLCDLSTKT